MKTLTPQLAAHYASAVTTICTCWCVTREDGIIMGFTDHNKDLTVDDLLYKASTGFTASSIQSKSDFSVDNLDLEGMISSDDIDEADILNGIYDYAEVEVFSVNYEDLSQGKKYDKRGRLGEVRVKRSQFVAELRGLSQHLAQHIGRIYTPSCDAVLGDARCKLNMAGFTFGVAVSSVTDRQTFAASALTQSAGYFVGGELIFTSGANSGLKMEIKEFAGGQVVLVLPMPNSVSVGNTFSIKAGCDKTDTTCKAKFGNLINFRGFARIPGMDKIMETAGTAQDVRAG